MCNTSLFEARQSLYAISSVTTHMQPYIKISVTVEYSKASNLELSIMHACVCVYIHVFVYNCVPVCVYVLMYVCIYVYMCVHVHMHVHVCVHLDLFCH